LRWKRTWVQALPWLSTCSLGLLASGTNLKSRKEGPVLRPFSYTENWRELLIFNFFFPLYQAGVIMGKKNGGGHFWKWNAYPCNRLIFQNAPTKFYILYATRIILFSELLKISKVISSKSKILWSYLVDIKE
jgi:hypothetical protein